MAKQIRIEVKTSVPRRRELRQARNGGRRSALGAGPEAEAPVPPYRHQYKADSEALVGRNDSRFHAIVVQAMPWGQKRDRARTARDLEDQRLPQLEAARAAAGSVWRAGAEYLLARGLQIFVAFLDCAGAMILMQRVQVPLGLPANQVRWVGAVALGSVIAILPAWAARTFEDWRIAMASDDPQRRHAAAARREHVLWRAAALIFIAVLVVGLIGYARATSPNAASGSSFASPVLAIHPLSWQALVLLGLIGILVAGGLEWFLESRRGAHEAHAAVLWCRFHRARHAQQIQTADKRLRAQVGRWTDLRTVEQREGNNLSARYRRLDDAWVGGAAPLTYVARAEPLPEVHPVDFHGEPSAAARHAVRDLEEAAAALLSRVDPYAVVHPRRPLPPLLAGVRQMVGVTGGRGA